VKQFQPVFTPAGETEVTRLDPLKPDSGYFRLRLVTDE